MNLCSNGHDEVCYESRDCPACEARVERDEAKETIIELLATLQEMRKAHADRQDS